MTITRKNRSDPQYVMSMFAGPVVKWALIICSMISVIFPLYWLLISAFKVESEYRAFPPVFIPTKITFDSFIQVFEENQLFENLTNSMIVSVVTTVVTIIAGAMAAYALQRGPLGRRLRHFFWSMVYDSKNVSCHCHGDSCLFGDARVASY